jgi:hypothetical protein
MSFLFLVVDNGCVVCKDICEMNAHKQNLALSLSSSLISIVQGELKQSVEVE